MLTQHIRAKIENLCACTCPLSEIKRRKINESKKMRLRVRNPSILGAFTGCLLTTLVYTVFSSTLTLTWNARRSVKESEEFDRRDVVPNAPIYSAGRDRDSITSLTQQKSVLQDPRYDQVSKQKLVRKMLLKIIATPKDNLMGALHKVNTSWGQDTEEWLMAVGTKDANKMHMGANEHVFFASKCQDFPERAYMSPRQLLCLLEAIYKSFYVEYQWFFVATEPIYVSVHQLERRLAKLDADNEVVYMGRPRARNRYCIGESGVVLSHTALREVYPHLRTCLEGNDSQSSTPKGDFALGTCFMKLQKTCYEEDDVSTFSGTT